MSFFTAISSIICVDPVSPRPRIWDPALVTPTWDPFVTPLEARVSFVSIQCHPNPKLWTPNWEHRMGNTELGTTTMNWEHRIGKRDHELGTPNWETRPRIGDPELGTPNWGPRIGDPELGTPNWGPRIGHRDPFRSPKWGPRIENPELGTPN
jgi:hypothetical protein